MTWTRYEVAVHGHGRPVCRRDGPCQGLLDWPRHRWTRITPRPVGLKRAKELADAQECHAVVCEWETSEKVHDNGKAPRVPKGWYPANAIMQGEAVAP